MEDPHIENGPENEQAEPQRLGSGSTAQQPSSEGPGRRPATHRGAPEFSELVLACRHRLRLLALAGAVVSTALVVLAWRLTTASYEAESLVRVRERQEVVFTPQTSRADDAAFVRAQQQLVLSPQVLSAALNDEQVRSLADSIPTHQPTDWLVKLLRVDIQTGAEVLSISAQHPSARVSQTLCNAVTRAYLHEVTSNLAAERQRRCEELERAARKADQRLDETWAELNRVASAVGSDTAQSLTIRDEIQLQAYREYAQQLRRAQLRGNELQSLLTDAQLKMAADDETLDGAIDEQLRIHPDVVAARNQLAEVDSRIAQMREVAAQDDSPKLKRLREERELLVAAVEKVMNDLRPQMRELAREQRRIEVENGVTQLRRQIELNQAEREFLHSRMAEIDTTVVRTDDRNGIQLEIARHAVDRQTRLADALAQSLEEFKIESQCQLPVALIEWAQLPDVAHRSRQLKAAAGAAGIGWLIAILGVGTLEWRGRRVRSGDDVRAHFAHPVFGAHPVKESLLRGTNSRASSGASEAAAQLMLCGSSGRGQAIPSVMVSSALASEPRHVVALDLARAFTGFHRRTLVIDGDRSGSSLSLKLGAAHLPGLVQFGSDQVDVRPYIVPTAEEGLDFLPFGIPQGAAAWVDPATLGFVLRSLRFDYDAIVINGPAIISSAESLLLASHVDQTLLAVFPGTSRWNELAASDEMAKQAGIAVFGAVLHSGERPATLTLRFDRQGAPRPAIETEDITEDNLQAGVAAMQRELGHTASYAAQWPTKSTDNMELTS